MRQGYKLVALVAWVGACQSGGKNPPSGGSSSVPVVQPTGPVVQVSNLFAAPTPSQPSASIPAPFSLTASDGTGLELTRISASAVVEGPLAFTELHLYFKNPEARTREGTFSITLPAGANVSRFAMEIDGQYLEAAVVEKQRARRVYEDFLHRRQDPALLEKGAGNEFSARVFPIAPSAEKHLVVSYAQDGTPGNFVLPLRGLAKVGLLDVRVQVRGADGALREQTLVQKDWKPDRDVTVVGAKSGAPQAIAAGELAAARLQIEMPGAAEPPGAITLLVDTSASRALGFAAEAARVRELVVELARAYGSELAIQIVAFDQGTTVLYEGRADGASDIERLLVQRGALGASDAGQALTWAFEHATHPRVVLFTDGVFTAGADAPGLRLLTAKLASRGVSRVDVVLTGGIRDTDAAAAIARAGLPRPGAVLDLDRGADEVARRLGLAVKTDLAITATGARWVSPKTIAAAQPGDEVTIFVRRDGPANQIALEVGGTKVSLAPVAVPIALLSRAVDGSEIAELDARLAIATGPEADTLRAEIIQRSIASRIVSSQTSMLVLESDADYERYGIDRTRLAEILTVGPRGVELMRPKAMFAQGAKQARPLDIASADGVMNDDADGTDESGGTGTAMALDEGRMGRRDREPRGSQYRMADERAEPSPAVVSAVAMAQNDADRQAASSRLRALQREQAELRQRVQEARATAQRAERVRGVRISRECMDNPLARGCDDGDAPRNPRSEEEELEEKLEKPALSGKLAEIKTLLGRGDLDGGLRKATAWRLEEPGNVLALVGLGDALEARKDLATAARVYGSIIDLFPARADFRRFAGERLERLGNAQRALVIDTYKRAVAERPDHMTGHRLLAYALVRDGKLADAFAAILAGIDQPYPDGRFLGGERVLREDAGMIGAAYAASVPAKRDEIVAALRTRKTELATKPSTRFIMYWETDANDVDFHIYDGKHGHAWYSHKQLESGGELYADITTGYGPECFAIEGTPSAPPYRLSINYYSQGPMGYGMGLLQIQTFDGKSQFTFEDRPYVIMTDHAFVDLGTYR